MPTRTQLAVFWKSVADVFGKLPPPADLTVRVPKGGHFMSLAFEGPSRGYQYQWIYCAAPPLVRVGLVFHASANLPLNQQRAEALAKLFVAEVTAGVVHLDQGDNNVTVMFYLPALSACLGPELVAYSAMSMWHFIDLTCKDLSSL